MLKNSLTKKKSLLIAGGIAGVLVLGGGGVALASGLDDGVSAQTRDRAQAAALAETGGGTVTEVDTLDDGLVALRLGAGHLLLLGGLLVGLADLLGGLLTLGVGDRLLGDGVLALARLRLLELPLVHEVVVAAHGSEHFLGLARDAVEQPFACLCGSVVAHVSASAPRRVESTAARCDVFEAADP